MRIRAAATGAWLGGWRDVVACVIGAALILILCLNMPASAQSDPATYLTPTVSPDFTAQSFARLGGATRLELTPDMLSSYISNRQTAKFDSAALQQANALATGSFVQTAPVPAVRHLTPELLQQFVSSRFVPTAEKVANMQRQRHCLAQAIYHEARGEPESGQWAVAEVIFNRAASPLYPDSVCGVVYQNASVLHHCQFSFACDGRPDDGGNGNRIVRESWVKANLIAEAAYQRHEQGDALTELPANALYYHNLTVRPGWANALQPVGKIGAHIFYAAL